MSEEQIIFRGSPSLVTRFGSMFLGFLVLVGALIGVFLIPKPLAWPHYLLMGIAGLAFIYLLVSALVVKATQYEITNERIRIRRGILTKRTDELELYRAMDTTLIEPLTMRMLGLGSIDVRTVDASTPNVMLEAIHKARQVREDLRKCIEECRDRKRVRMTEFDSTPPPEGDHT
ncbi:MAG: PH domain-containing protein [Verrucomicrobiota bacterium]|jgi:uncharacterized membrane protein YdbT with pleckstrin-like domain